MDLIGLHLKDAIERRGCPVCRILEDFEDREMDTILYEHVNDPKVREKFKESLGLCPYHAWKLLKTAYSNPLYGGLGVAMIYEHMLGVYLDSLERREEYREGKCHLCKLLEEKERLTIEALADRLEELMETYETSEAVLCKRHYEMLMTELRERPEVMERLRDVQIRKLRLLKKRLNGFIDKFDYRSHEKPSDREVAAVKGTVEALKGLPLPLPTTGKGKGARRIVLRWKV